jgi:hypothetical protein
MPRPDQTNIRYPAEDRNIKIELLTPSFRYQRSSRPTKHCRVRGTRAARGPDHGRICVEIDADVEIASSLRIGWTGVDLALVRHSESGGVADAGWHSPLCRACMLPAI